MAATKAGKSSASTSLKQAAAREATASIDEEAVSGNTTEAAAAARGVKRSRPKAASASEEEEEVAVGQPRNKGKSRVVGTESRALDSRRASKKSKSDTANNDDGRDGAVDMLRQSQTARHNAQIVAGASPSLPSNNNSAKVATLQDEVDRLHDAYNALKEQLNALRNVRETIPEARLAEQKQESDTRVQAAHTALRPYTAENQDLKAENMNLKRQILELAQLDPNEREGAFRQSNGPTQEQYETLQAENEELRTEAARDMEERKALKLDLRSCKQKYANEISRLQSDTALTIARLTDDQQAALEKAGVLERELHYEIQQSKKMISANKPSAQNGSLSLTNSDAASQANSRALSFYKSAQELLADLTGLLLVNGSTSENGKYDFVMSDGKKRKSLHFRLEQDDASDDKLVYAPELEPERDREIMQILDETLRSSIKFDRNQLPYFFKRLWRVFNDPKKHAA